MAKAKLKKLVKEQIEDRVTSYGSKKIKPIAKQLLDDVDWVMGPFQDKAWEVVLDVAVDVFTDPVTGTVYTGTKTALEARSAYKRYELLKSRADVLINTVKRRGNIRGSFTQRPVRATEQVHHIIDTNSFESNSLIFSADEAGFSINNGDVNGMPLDAKFHGKSNAYSEYIQSSVDAWAKNYKKANGAMPNGTAVKDYLENKLIPEAKSLIESAEDS